MSSLFSAVQSSLLSLLSIFMSYLGIPASVRLWWRLRRACRVLCRAQCAIRTCAPVLPSADERSRCLSVPSRANFALVSALGPASRRSEGPSLLRLKVSVSDERAIMSCFHQFDNVNLREFFYIIAFYVLFLRSVNFCLSRNYSHSLADSPDAYPSAASPL